MESRICPSCGGIIGRDCFNPEECQWITDQMNRQQDEEEERRINDENERKIHNEQLRREAEDPNYLSY